MFENLWKSPAPSKVVALAWKVLINRVPTKGNLALRNVLNPEESTSCVMCIGVEESSTHLFLHCDVASLVWLKLMMWLDCWFRHTTIWVMWKKRNDKIFKGINFQVDELVEEIKVLSWRWMLQWTHTPSCHFCKWCWNPRLCLER